MAECPNCGSSVASGSRRCIKCGAALDPAPQPAAAAAPAGVPPGTPAQPVAATGQKSKLAAGLLGIFLGTLGIHNFYLGRAGRGVIQLLLTIFTCGYGAIITWPWSLVESILIFTGSTATDARGVPLKD